MGALGVTARWIRDASRGASSMSSQPSWGGPEPGPSPQECERTASGCNGLVSGAQKCGGASTRDRRLSRIQLGAVAMPIESGKEAIIGRVGWVFLNTDIHVDSSSRPHHRSTVKLFIHIVTVRYE
jgi:hypothetical protein